LRRSLTEPARSAIPAKKRPLEEKRSPSITQVDPRRGAWQDISPE
jgi:hypothetical protein